MLLDHQVIQPSVFYFGTPITLIVTRNPDGIPNITPMSSVWALGKSLVLGLSSAGQGMTNLLRERECTLNFPSANLWPQVERIAKTTGANPVPPYKAELGFRHSGDKFALGGFTPQNGDLVNTPRIAECALQVEAILLQANRTAHASKNEKSHSMIVEVEILRIHARRDILAPGANHIDTAQWNPLFYVFRHYFGNAVDLGKNFRAEH